MATENYRTATTMTLETGRSRQPVGGLQRPVFLTFASPQKGRVHHKRVNFRAVGQPELIKRPKSSGQVNFLFARHPPTPAVPLPPTKPGECRTLGDFSMPHPYLGLKSAQKEHT